MFEGESAAPGGVFRLTGPRVSSDLLACQHTPPLLKHCRVILTLRLKTGNPIFLWQRFYLGCCSVAVTSNSLRSHGLQHARLPCPSPSPRVCPSSHPSSWWCHPTISSSVAPSPLPSIFPSIHVFLMSQLFPSGGWSIGASASASVLPKRIQGWFPFKIDWFDHLLFLRTLLQHHSSKASILRHSAFCIVQLSHLYMTTGRTMKWSHSVVSNSLRPHGL